PSISTPYAVNSRLFFEGTVTATDMSRATNAASARPAEACLQRSARPLSAGAKWQLNKGRIGITGSSQAYGGSNGRVTSESIGRDVNPLGRGGGAALVGGCRDVGIL